MPMYDKQCNTCGRIAVDIYEPIDAPAQPCEANCAGVLERAWINGKGPKAHGDECDLWIKNGICNEDGTPKHYTSKAEMKRAADAKGLVNRVRHLGTKGGDRSKWTTRWT